MPPATQPTVSAGQKGAAHFRLLRAGQRSRPPTRAAQEILTQRCYGKGARLMVYERAYHRFQAVEVAGQAEAEGRG